MDLQFLSTTPLFHGTTEEEVKEMLNCLGARTRSYKKGSLIYQAGDTVHAMGLVLTGSVTIENDDIWGRRNILSHISPGQVFAETYACISSEPLLVNVTAAESTEVLFLNVNRLLTTCQNSCVHHTRLIHNLLSISARKNLALSRRILHTSPRTIRERLLSYLSEEALRQGSCQFTIPFDRQQLADYLSVDRSALSAELGKMQREGLITFRKNYFELKAEDFSEK